MEYTLETKVRFATALGRSVQEEISTLEELGFSKDELERKTAEEIEKEIQEMFFDWERNHLDSGWAVVEG